MTAQTRPTPMDILRATSPEGAKPYMGRGARTPLHQPQEAR